MINGKASDFIDKLYYEDHYVIYNGNKYFLNGCQTQKDNEGNIVAVRLEVYNLSEDETILSISMPSASECIDMFENSPIWNDKTFWEAESEIEWVDE